MRMSGSEVEIIMARQELTKMSMAEKIGISRNRLYTALNSKNLAPATVGRIAKVLGVDVEEILEDESR
ncbi:MAG: helix-turn-helix domain-containing protein [Lachnospiraceae bacterium]